KKAITYGINNVPNSTWYLAGEIAERCNQVDDAAHYYSQAEINFDSFVNNQANTRAKENLLRLARSYSQKGSHPNSIESI
ncbi:hypothetical protein NQU49_27780, partial [Escherichia coli]|uniref:hypothetical protein n=1 Tax=Escherichia coli TaxID=562 RepID=UPI002117DB88